jgi:hypothetical protein
MNLNNSISKNKGTFLICIVLFVLIAPLLFLCKYNLPWYDDYYVATLFRSVDYFDLQSYWYMNWSGRYTSSGIIALLNPLNYSYSGIAFYGCFSAFIILLFAFSLYRFVSELLPSAPREYKLGFFTGLFYIFFYIMPSPTEFFFWFVGAWTYTIGLIIALELGVGLIRLNYDFKRNRFIYVIILSILLPGTNEVVTLIFLSSYAIIMILSLISKKKPHKYNYLIMFSLAIFTLISFLAPGNSVRAEWGIEQGLVNRNLFDVIVITIKELTKLVMKWTFLSPFLIVSLLSLKLMPYLNKDLKALVDTNLKLAFWLIASNIAIFAFVFPVFWSSGDAPDRIYNPIALYFLISTGLSILFYFDNIKTNKLILSFPVTLLLCVFLFFQTLSSRNRISRVWIELRSGEAKAYFAELNKNFEFCRSNPNQKIVLKPLSNRPYTILMDDLRPDSTDWANLHFSQFHGIASVRTVQTNAAYVETNSDTTLNSR